MDLDTQQQLMSMSAADGSIGDFGITVLIFIGVSVVVCLVALYIAVQYNTIVDFIQHLVFRIKKFFSKS